MMYFTADLHLRHWLMVKLRGFDTVDEMNETLIENYNKVIKHNDEIWMLGDIGFGKFSEVDKLIRRLKGRKFLVLGNHDARLEKDYKKSGLFENIFDFKEIKIQKQRISLFHYPIESWSACHYGSWHLHGHSHCNKPFNPNMKRLDVGVDGKKDFSPYSLDEVREIFNNATNFKYYKHTIKENDDANRYN